METKVNMGEVITFSSGAYSDYSYCGSVVFRTSCDLMEQRANYEAFCRTNKAHGGHGEFVTFLCGQGFCLPLENREIHLGAYGDLLGTNTYDWDEM